MMGNRINETVEKWLLTIKKKVSAVQDILLTLNLEGQTKTKLSLRIHTKYGCTKDSFWRSNLYFFCWDRNDKCALFKP